MYHKTTFVLSLTSSFSTCAKTLLIFSKREGIGRVRANFSPRSIQACFLECCRSAYRISVKKLEVVFRSHISLSRQEHRLFANIESKSAITVKFTSTNLSSFMPKDIYIDLQFVMSGCCCSIRPNASFCKYVDMSRIAIK